jgi:hypothetical protein
MKMPTWRQCVLPVFESNLNLPPSLKRAKIEVSPVKKLVFIWPTPLGWSSGNRKIAEPDTNDPAPSADKRGQPLALLAAFAFFGTAFTLVDNCGFAALGCAALDFVFGFGSGFGSGVTTSIELTGIWAAGFDSGTGTGFASGFG